MTIELAKIMQEAGIPKGALKVAAGPHVKLAELIANHPNVGMLAFTGSTGVRRRLAELLASTMKKAWLEFGGKASFIVFPDADADA